MLLPHSHAPLGGKGEGHVARTYAKTYTVTGGLLDTAPHQAQDVRRVVGVAEGSQGKQLNEF